MHLRLFHATNWTPSRYRRTVEDVCFLSNRVPAPSTTISIWLACHASAGTRFIAAPGPWIAASLTGSLALLPALEALSAEGALAVEAPTEWMPMSDIMLAYMRRNGSWGFQCCSAASARSVSSPTTAYFGLLRRMWSVTAPPSDIRPQAGRLVKRCLGTMSEWQAAAGRAKSTSGASEFARRIGKHDMSHPGPSHSGRRLYHCATRWNAGASVVSRAGTRVRADGRRPKQTLAQETVFQREQLRMLADDHGLIS
ncbi:hypothetical protein K458DRAFT_395106 [Lentithecium fluviatile CBS 122367]|uniref:Uncharacterized protein n=1 Tax=Lentithecium fluviatile CBS 122367 TaxID=1168545 RepID=A0A6G1IJ68_9PLEO|nr:hypothetical protein K458DRAFT_395106 [Lentithecium fluviatile CBS 122367]